MIKICDGCSSEISAFTAMMNSRLGPMDHSRLNMCNQCRDRLTQALAPYIEPRNQSGYKRTDESAAESFKVY